MRDTPKPIPFGAMAVLAVIGLTTQAAKDPLGIDVPLRKSTDANKTVPGRQMPRTGPPPPSAFQDEPSEREIENSLSMKLCWCPAGTFHMGSPKGEKGHSPDEVQHRVKLSRGFWMGKYEVTRDQYQHVMETSPTAPADAASNAPVDNVTWEQASAFCRKLTSMERRSANLPADWEYRLPTEAEWEYACRAGTSGSFGDILPNADRPDYIAWYHANSRSTIHPVGQRRANTWGLHDMHGNAEEWCRDFYGSYTSIYYGDSSDVFLLPEVTDPIGPGIGAVHVRRGGSYYSSAEFCRSAYRNGYEITQSRFSHGSELAGFRVVAAKKQRTTKTNLLPTFEVDLQGPNPIRIRNPNTFSVTAGIRSGSRGVDLEIPPNDEKTVGAPNGQYTILFVYSNETNALYAGDLFFLKDKGISITITTVENGNYRIQRIK